MKKNALRPLYFAFTMLSLMAGMSAPPHLYAQEYQLLAQKIPTLPFATRGPSSGYCYSSFCDADGFMWFSTGDGISRFDGRSYDYFEYPKELATPAVLTDIFEDKEGWIWVLQGYYGTFNLENIVFVHKTTGKVARFAERFPDAKTRPQPNTTINTYENALHHDKNGNITFTTPSGSLLTYLGNGVFKEEKIGFLSKGGWTLLAESANGDRIWCHTPAFSNTTGFDKSGLSFVKTNAAHQIIDRQTFTVDVGEIHTFRLLNIRNRTILSIGAMADRLGPNPSIYPHYWCEWINGKGIVPLDWETLGVPTNQLPVNFDKHGFFYYSSATDVLYFHTERGGMFYAIPLGKGAVLKQALPSFSTNPNGVGKPTVDKFGNFWLVSTEEITVYNVQKQRFTKYLYQKDVTVGTSCRGMTTLGNYLYICSYSGFHKVPLEDPDNYFFRDNHYCASVWQPASAKPKSYYTGVQCVLRDRQNQIWMGSWGIFLAFRDGNNCSAEITDVWQAVPSNQDRETYMLYEDKHGNIWQGSLGYLNPHTLKTTFTSDDPKFKAFKEALVYAFHDSPTGDGTAWVATREGLLQMDMDKGVLATYGSSQKGDYFLPAQSFKHLYFDPDGSWWLATDNGLIHWSADKKTYQHYTVANGLANNNLHAIYPDAYGFLWFSSEGGLIQFNKEAKTMRTYTIRDGITHTEFNRAAHYQAPDGTIYFGSINGVTAFHPKDFVNPLDSNLTDIPLMFTGFAAYSQKKKSYISKIASDYAHAAPPKPIVLRPSERTFDVSVALLEYFNNDQIVYYYRLDDGDWFSQKESTIRFNHFAYGKHTLYVKGRLPNGLFAQTELALPIVLKRPFYLQGWFFVLLLVLGVAGVYRYLQYRTTAFRQRQLQLEQMVAERTATIERQTQELLQLDNLKTRFFANVSHELRTPIALLLGPIGTVLNSRELSAQNNTLLATAHQNARKLLSLVNEILDLNKLEVGKMTPRLYPVGLHELMNRLAAAFESYADQRGVMFLLENEVSPYTDFMLDGDKLEKIINNLLSNAFKFTPRSGSVTLRTHETALHLRFEVSDTGTGIHADDLPHLFDRFYQARHGDNPLLGGTGIGLAICQEFAKLMGGDIGVQSKLGEGSTFWVMLPRQLATASSSQPLDDEPIFDDPHIATIESPAARHPQSVSVLVVEDNLQLSAYIQLLLGTDYQVSVAENGKAALELLDTLPKLPHLILTDLMMPVMDGYQLINNLKQNPRYQLIPVIVLTARATLDDKLHALRVGVDSYMTKPFEEAELFAQVRNLLQRFHQKTEFVATQPVPNDEPPLTVDQQAWLKNLEEVVEKNLTDFQLTAEGVAEEMAMSRASFFRTLKALTGLTPAHYIQEMRFRKAMAYLESGTYSSVKAVSYSVGLRDEKHFSRKFKERFGKLPSEIANSQHAALTSEPASVSYSTR